MSFADIMASRATVDGQEGAAVKPRAHDCHCAQASLSAAVAAALGGEQQLIVPRPAPLARALGSRRRLWEVPARHHGVLLGAAFDARELRQMFRRARFTDGQTASDYELHSSAVCFAKERNDFSALAQKSLEERFRPAVNRLAAAANANDIRRYWHAMVEQGEAVGAYWAALTHSCCDPEMDEELLRDMHMIAHEEFAARRASLRRVRVLEERAIQIAGWQAAAQQDIAGLRKHNAELSKALGAARAEAHALHKELEAWRSSDAARAMRARQAELVAALEASRLETEAALRSLRDAERRVQRMKVPGVAEARAARPASAPPGASPQPIHAPNLRGRRVLCIGGKTPLMPQYRAVIEDAQGEFAHHDGGIEDHVGRLPAMLGAAEFVICLAADCSHAAYRLAKRYCKAKSKPCALIGNSSVTALARCLRDLGARRFNSGNCRPSPG